jgi:Protein of unknown function (DUF1573)
VKKVMLCALALGLLAPAGAQEQRKPVPPGVKAETEGPRIAVEPASFDFGKAMQNKTLSKEFSIKNYGNQDLVIENVSTTCGCTVAEGYARRIKPGESTPLRVSLETRAYKGKVERDVLVRSNDAATSLLKVRVEAMVAPAAEK